jgi:valyl-tRNA synthetase
MAKGKGFDFKSVEEKWKGFWEKEEIYKFNPNAKGKIYSVDTPPPYISGRMHIGHAFSYAQQDFIVRFMRMNGRNIFYPFGTDDNGLPTERFIEKVNKVKSRKMGRTDFINLCLKTLKKETPECIKDFVNLGISSDYDIYYSTIDKHSQKISQSSFLELFKKKDIYRKDFPTPWCSECDTSIAQAEFEDKSGKGLFSTLKFKSDGKDLLIATTRPELLNACVAVFVNPKDKRYKGLVGKKAKVPLFDFEVPILADESAEIDKGTGVLMICSYGDKFDVEAIQKHKLKPKIILDRNGKILEGDYKGLGVKEAREKTLEDLKKKGLIKEQKEIEHVVNCHDKCGTEIEFLPTKQWFIRLLDKKKIFIEQAKKVKWYPEFMFKRYENWVNGLEWDWSISRNRHFGIPIPVWYCEKCEEIILPEEKELPVDPLQTKKKCPKCEENAEPEKMVLDTWATSSLTPQIAAALPQAKGKVKLPFSLRPQGHDIIRTWAFYTIVKAYLHEKEIPWEDIIVSGNVSLGGEKMSKSKGNTVDPVEVMGEHGADALRFWASASKLGNDLDYQEKDLITGKKFINKLVNASRFVFMNLEGYKGQKPKKFEKIDELFLKELNRVIGTTTIKFKDYEYSKARFNTEEFFWQDFTDNYIEIVKKRVYKGKGDKKVSAQYVLYQSLLSIVKMLAPIMPFITEEIYQEYFRKTEKEKSIHLCKWPEFDNKNEWSEKDVGTFVNRWFLLKDVISKIRKVKSENGKPMNSEINLILDKKNYSALKDVLDALKDVMNIGEISEGKFKVEFK